MSGRRSIVLWLVCSAAVAAAWAQQQENLVRWPYYKQVVTPPAPVPVADLLLDADVLSHSRRDHADLRLYDEQHREIPYALRVLRKETQADSFEAREFNRGTYGASTEVFLDLGDYSTVHNQVEVDTPGRNFRRQVEVDGSDDRLRWSTLAERAFVFRFESSRGSVYENRVRYPECRFRYLRVRVHADDEVDEEAPAIEDVQVRRIIDRSGEYLFFQAQLRGREPTREEGRAASAYEFHFDGRLPLEAIRINVAEGVFSRPYRLEAVGDTQDGILSSGQLARRESEPPDELTVSFREKFVRRLRLTVIDDRNAPLSVVSVRGESAARRILFEPQGPAGMGLRLYYGYQKAAAPHYDFAHSLDAETVSAQRLSLGPQAENPDYEPEPKPLSERSPWLIYLVLACASAGLFLLLRGLARDAARGGSTSGDGSGPGTA